METIRSTVQGVPVLITPIDHARGAAITVWSRLGARDEQAPEAYGLTHFLEHMVFKGSETMTASDLARAAERVGGDLDAFTSRDHTCFVAKVPANQAELGVSLLTELLARPAFREEDLERERSVVLEEIRMSRDDPDDSGDEAFLSRIYPSATLGRSILGTDETVSAIRRDQLVRWWQTCLGRRNVVISAAGKVEPERLIAGLAGLVSELPDGEAVPDPGPQRFTPGAGSTFRDQMESVNVYAAFEAPAPDLDTQQVLSVLNNVLGGGMSSRLFRKIREDRGLAYAVYGAPSWFRHEGHLYLTATTAAAQAPLVRDLMVEEALTLKDTLTEAEVADAVSQLAGRIELALETSASRAMFHGRYEIQYGQVVSLDELMARVRDISYDRVRSLAADMLTRDRLATLMYGNVAQDAGEAGA